jgi:hypothetical protein
MSFGFFVSWQIEEKKYRNGWSPTVEGIMYRAFPSLFSMESFSPQDTVING